MQWNDGNIWTLDVNIPGGEGLEFKVGVFAYLLKASLPALPSCCRTVAALTVCLSKLVSKMC